MLHRNIEHEEQSYEEDYFGGLHQFTAVSFQRACSREKAAVFLLSVVWGLFPFHLKHFQTLLYE